MNPAMRQENVFGNLIWCVSPENVFVIHGITKEIPFVIIVCTPIGLCMGKVDNILLFIPCFNKLLFSIDNI